MNFNLFLIKQGRTGLFAPSCTVAFQSASHKKKHLEELKYLIHASKCSVDSPNRPYKSVANGLDSLKEQAAVYSI